MSGRSPVQTSIFIIAKGEAQYKLFRGSIWTSARTFTEFTDGGNCREENEWENRQVLFTQHQCLLDSVEQHLYYLARKKVSFPLTNLALANTAAVSRGDECALEQSWVAIAHDRDEQKMYGETNRETRKPWPWWDTSMSAERAGRRRNGAACDYLWRVVEIRSHAWELEERKCYLSLQKGWGGPRELQSQFPWRGNGVPH